MLKHNNRIIQNKEIHTKKDGCLSIIQKCKGGMNSGDESYDSQLIKKQKVIKKLKKNKGK